LQKQALLLESALNRHALQSEFRQLRNAVRAPRQFAPLLVVLAPLAGFLLVRTVRRPDSWFKRLAAVAKWIGPLYSLWRTFSAAIPAHKPEPLNPEEIA